MTTASRRCPAVRLSASALLAGALTACAPQIAPPPALYSVVDVPVTTLRRDLTEGRVTSVQLVEQYLARIDDLDRRGPQLHSVIAINPEALAEATRLDAERAAGRLLGPLHGIPVVLKDNIELSGPLPTTAGSLALEQNVTGRDAPVVSRLRADGAIILAKTNLSEWANIRSPKSTSGWSAVGGLTKNPYALDRNPCGSSSGSGVAVAASLAAAAVGTETDGSVTCPAAINGLVGLKPTLGFISRRHIVPISSAQDTAGPMARTVGDTALMLLAMAGSDPQDAATEAADAHKSRDSARWAAVASGHGEPPRLDGRRLGIMRFHTGYDPRLDALFEQALTQLRAAGATIVDIPSVDGLDAIAADELTVLLTDLRVDLNAYLASTPATVTTRTLAEVMAFNRANAAREMPHFGQEFFEQAEATANHDPTRYATLRTRVKQAAAGALDAMLASQRLDALIAPTTGPAWLTDLAQGDSFSGSASTLPAVAGYPHLTVPMGLLDGLPVGLSFIGTAWADASLLSLGHAYEQRTKMRRAPSLGFTSPAAAPAR